MPSFREMNLAVFRGEDPGGVLWQPRLEYWYDVNKKRGTLPEHLKEASLLDVGPRRCGSISSMISMARTFGAPETVPAGRQACKASNAVLPGASWPSTFEVMCITWL